MAQKIRPNLGYTGTWTDSGPRVDAECLMWIGDPLHTLNQMGRYDPTRYNLEKPEVSRQFETIRDRGVPSAIIVRINGDLPKGHPVYDYLKQQYPKGSKDAYDGSPQPNIEIIAGNCRRWLALLAIEARIESGAPVDVVRRVPIDVRKNVSNAMMVDIFEEENNNRQANGWFQQLLNYRSRLAEGMDPEAIGKRMGQPPRIIAEFAVFDVIEDEVARRYSAGQVTLARVKELAAVPRAEQVAQLDARPQVQRQKREGGPLSPVKMRRAADAIIAADPILDSELSLKDVAAVLRFASGDHNALDGKEQAWLKRVVNEALS